MKSIKNIIFKSVSISLILSAMLSAQYYENNNYSAYNYYNYYNEFMKFLAREANNPNSIYYSPLFAQQYNNYNTMPGDPYQNTMNAMNYASQNYTNYVYYNINPYEELMKMLERESKNPSSQYYSPNYNQNQYNNNSYKNYCCDNSYNENPYYKAAEELINEAEESSRNSEQKNNNTEYVQDFYTPFKVPQAVFNTAIKRYPDVQILDVEMKDIGIYEVKMSNMMRLYIDRKGNLINEILEN